MGAQFKRPLWGMKQVHNHRHFRSQRGNPGLILRLVGLLFILVPTAFVFRLYIYFTRDKVMAYFHTPGKTPTASA